MFHACNGPQSVSGMLLTATDKDCPALSPKAATRCGMRNLWHSYKRPVNLKSARVPRMWRALYRTVTLPVLAWPQCRAYTYCWILKYDAGHGGTAHGWPQGRWRPAWNRWYLWWYLWAQLAIPARPCANSFLSSREARIIPAFLFGRSEGF
jgi:hypothetical protein